MNTYIIIILVVTVIGLINTIYLSYCCFTNKDVICLFFPPAMCDKVQHSQYSRTFGIPNPYLGLGMLSAILLSTILVHVELIPFWIVFAIITGGFLFSVYFLYIQSFILKAFCTWCVLSALVFAILFYVSLQLFLIS